MAFNEELAGRVRELLKGKRPLEEKRMFGGLAFMLRGHMACGIDRETLMIRVLPDKYEALLKRPHARVMDLTGRALRGFLFIDRKGYSSDKGLRFWVDQAIEFASAQPIKPPKRKKPKAKNSPKRTG